MPKISCLMTTRNRDDLIGESIKSVIDQTFTDWELIIVDDHSDEDDKTEAVVKSFQDQRIKYFRLYNEQGRGIPAGRNLATILASGEFIAIADSDDINYPFRFDLSLKEFKNKDIDLTYGNIDCWDLETNKIFSRPDEYEVRKFNLEDFIKADFIPNPTIMYKKTIGYNFPYNSFFRKGEDYEFISRLVVNNLKFSFIPESLVRYRVHQGSTSGQDAKGIKYASIIKENRGWKTEQTS